MDGFFPSGSINLTSELQLNDERRRIAGQVLRKPQEVGRIEMQRQNALPYRRFNSRIQCIHSRCAARGRGWFINVGSADLRSKV